jgi:hypothetical protein
MIGKHSSIFGMGRHGILSSPCGNYIHNKRLYHAGLSWHDGCCLNYGTPEVWANFRPYVYEKAVWTVVIKFWGCGMHYLLDRPFLRRTIC